jgi:flagella synthesis protein FlgN
LSNTGNDATQQTDSIWRDLLKTLAVCRDKNQRNGALVNQRLTQVRRALSVLTGNDSQASTYGQNGAVHDSHRSVPLAQV